MSDERLAAGGHKFPTVDASCKVCGVTWRQFWDKDSKDYKLPCRGKTDKPERMFVEE